MVLTGWLVPYLEDALFGLAFLLLACFTLFRTLTFIHLRGKGNYVIKAFHALICITGLLRCAWFWRSPNTFIFLRNSESAETPGEFMSQTLNTLGTISLYCSFLILCCYWSYMLEHVTIKSNVEPHCFVPTHLLPGGGGGGGGVLAASDGIDTAGPFGSCSWLYSCCMSCSWSSCCCRTTVIEVYLLCMKALLLCGLANLGAFVSLQVDYTSMARGQAVIECLAAFATMTTLTVLSRRIRSLLQGLGVAQSQPAIEQHLSRIVTVTVGVNAYLCAHVAMLLFYLHVTTSSSEWALLLCADKRSWSLFVGLRYGSEVAVMCVELFVSRILQKKGAGAKAGGGGGGGGGVADSPRQRNSGARVIGVSGGRGASKGASRSSEFGVQTDDEFAYGGGAMLVGAADIEMAASPPGLVSSGGAGTSSGATAYSNKTITVGRGKGSGGGAASERTPLLSSVGVLGLGALAARAAVAPSPRKK